MAVIVFSHDFKHFTHYLYHYSLFHVIVVHILIITFDCLIVNTYVICHKKHTAKYTNEISEHGAFPLVSVWVGHGEPGNMHPYNFEAHFCQNVSLDVLL